MTRSNQGPVIVTQRLPISVETRMRELFEVEFNQTEFKLNHDELCTAISRATVLVPTVTDEINAEVIAHASDDLKMIANYGSGVDHIDLVAANKRGIVVTNTPNVLTNDTADLAMALILTCMRRLVEGAFTLRTDPNSWPGWAPTTMLGRSLSGTRLGIVGMGRIGGALAKRARVFGMQIHYHNRHRVPHGLERTLEAAYWDKLESMLTHVDVVSVNCPATNETRHMFDKKMLSLLPAHAVIVNTARGDIIDEGALIDLLERDMIQGVGLDVFEHEPSIDPRLINHPKAVCVPHLGSATRESRRSMGERVIINIQTLFDQHTPPDQVLE